MRAEATSSMDHAGRPGRWAGRATRSPRPAGNSRRSRSRGSPFLDRQFLAGHRPGEPVTRKVSPDAGVTVQQSTRHDSLLADAGMAPAGMPCAGCPGASYDPARLDEVRFARTGPAQLLHQRFGGRPVEDAEGRLRKLQSDRRPESRHRRGRGDCLDLAARAVRSSSTSVAGGLLPMQRPQRGQSRCAPGSSIRRREQSGQAAVPQVSLHQHADDPANPRHRAPGARRGDQQGARRLLAPVARAPRRGRIRPREVWPHRWRGEQGRAGLSRRGSGPRCLF